MGDQNTATDEEIIRKKYLDEAENRIRQKIEEEVRKAEAEGSKIGSGRKPGENDYPAPGKKTGINIHSIISILAFLGAFFSFAAYMEWRYILLAILLVVCLIVCFFEGRLAAAVSVKNDYVSATTGFDKGSDRERTVYLAKEAVSERILAIRKGETPEIAAFKEQAYLEAEKRIKEELSKQKGKGDDTVMQEQEEAYRKQVEQFKERLLISDVSFSPILRDAMACLQETLDGLQKENAGNNKDEFYEVDFSFDVKSAEIRYNDQDSSGSTHVFNFREHRYQDLDQQYQREGFALVLMGYIDAELEKTLSEEDCRRRWIQKGAWMRLKMQFINPDYHTEELQRWDA